MIYILLNGNLGYKMVQGFAKATRQDSKRARTKTHVYREQVQRAIQWDILPSPLGSTEFVYCLFKNTVFSENPERELAARMSSLFS